ncbi:hypothetical protein [Kribbella italica]|uniref:Uncharacterized protein n=1 Tax=Kribbella italica TaxID=1540520 RepID=A0A7W9MXE7_9ACTN|nr:hypothetical protein [Kribbella italica]MBB5839684.1 hypothetical protein [Kribbella italica]
MRGIGRKAFKDGSLVPPPRLVRYFTVVIAVVMLVQLRDDHTPQAIAFAAFFCLLALGNTVGEKFLYGDRSQDHPVLDGLLGAVLMTLSCFILLSFVLGSWTSLLIAVPIGIAAGGFGEQRRRARTAVDPPSRVDDGPTS